MLMLIKNNSLKSVLFWAIFNALFFAVNMIGSDMISSDSQIIVRIIYYSFLILMMVGALFLAFRFGKTFLKSNYNVKHNLISLLFGHVLILLMLCFAQTYDPWLDYLIEWPIEIFQQVLGLRPLGLRMARYFSCSFVFSLIFSFVPYGFMLWGLSKKEVNEEE